MASLVFPSLPFTSSPLTCLCGLVLMPLFWSCHPDSLHVSSFISQGQANKFLINTLKCYFAVKPIHAVALIDHQLVIIRIRFPKIRQGSHTVLGAYKLIIINNTVQLLEEKLGTILTPAFFFIPQYNIGE